MSLLFQSFIGYHLQDTVIQELCVPEASCDQSHAKAVVSPSEKEFCKSWKTIAVFHNESSRSMYFRRQLFTLTIYPR